MLIYISPDLESVPLWKRQVGHWHDCECQHNIAIDVHGKSRGRVEFFDCSVFSFLALHIWNTLRTLLGCAIEKFTELDEGIPKKSWRDEISSQNYGTNICTSTMFKMLEIQALIFELEFLISRTRYSFQNTIHLRRCKHQIKADQQASLPK